MTTLIARGVPVITISPFGFCVFFVDNKSQGQNGDGSLLTARRAFERADPTRS